MSDVRTFSANIDKWLDQSVEKARLKFISICLEAAQEVIQRTPVDTGFARANWAVSINRLPNFQILHPRDDGGKSQRPRGGKLRKGYVPPVDTGGSYAADPAAIFTATSKAGIGDVVYIYNPVVYAKRLEDGWSKQAPAGMVAVTFAALQAKYS